MPVLAQDLRNAVLQAAMEGKLTKRIADDTLVLDSLDKIKQDRNNRISKKEIKNDKRLFDKVITVERFDIPDSWKWIRLGEVLYKLTDGTHKTPKYTSSGIKFVSVKDMSSGFLNLSNTKYISEKEHSELFSRCNPQKGDILLSKVGTTGVPAIVDTDEEFSLFVSVALLKFNDSLINKEYLYRVLQSPDVQQQAAENTKGIGNKNWVLDKIANTEIPLAPIEEQQRIVDKLNQIIPLIDEYEKLEKQLEELKKEFPGDMKQAVLQAAMEGKLTEQLESDSSSFKLAELIKIQRNARGENKYLCNKDLDINFPNNWTCIKSGECFSLENGEKITGVSLPYLEAKFLRGKIPATLKTSGQFVRKGTKVILVDGENSGEIFTEPEDGIMGSTFKILYIPSEINQKYALYYLNMQKDLFRGNKKGAAIPHLNKEIFNNLWLPIPPIEEQQCIVDKLDELLPLVDKLAELN